MEIDKSKLSPESKIMVDLLLSPQWPEAVQPFLICSDTEADKIERAEGIASYFEVDWNNKKILDFGCGEGHLAYHFQKQGAKSFGYDIIKTGALEWEAPTNTLLTTDFKKIKESKPFDYVILYDVLDHCTDPVATLKQIHEVCDQKTTLLVRCHSWMSRHGGHLYKKLNKAYIQLFFSPKELEIMGLVPETTQKYYFPILTHKEWFKNAGFMVVKEDVVQSFIEDFFRKKEMSDRLPNLWQGQYPEWQMSQAFNDYKLKIIS
jgi:2-polyprenyl-3-methyl-5-hydroxy-6-metoxy-1,4-benzoquinol methylase